MWRIRSCAFHQTNLHQLVEQNIAFARRASQRFAILNRGSVAVSGPIGQLSDEMIHQHLVV